MNKKVSKTLAAVLSAAMAASAFAVSTGAAFAAPNISISVDPLEVSLTEETTSYNVTQTATDAAVKAAITAELDGQDVTVEKVSRTSDWTSSNTNLAEITSDGKVTVQDINITSRQEVTFSSKYKVNLTGYEDGAHGATGSTTAEVTVSVKAAIYPEGEYVILPRLSSQEAIVDGDDMIPDTNKTISINEETYYDLYQVRALNGTGYAQFNRLQSDGKHGTVTSQWAPELSDVEVSVNTSKVTWEPTAGWNSIQINPQDPANVQTGNVIISATAKDAKGNDVNIQSASVTIDDTYLFETGDSVTVDASYGQDTKTLIADDDNVRGSEPKYDVTGMDVIVDSGATLTLNTNLAGAELGNITDAGAEIGNVNVQSGTVGDIDVEGTVSVGNASTKGATVGNVVAGNNVTITGSTAEVGPAVTVGNVTGDKNVTITASDLKSNGQYVGGGNVTVGDVAGAGTVTLKAGSAINTMTLGSVSGIEGTYPDCPYTAKLSVTSGTFDLGDLLYFGSITISKDVNVTAGAIDTGAAGTTHANPTATSTSSLTVNGRLTIDSLKVNKVNSGNGTIIAPVNSVEVTGTTGATGTTLLVEDANVGDVLYSSTSSNNNMFLMPGVTAVESTTAGQNVYTYTVDSLALRGVLMEQTGTVEVGTAGTTLSVMKMPFMAEMPEGVTVEWSANRDSVTLTPSADGLSCQVAATGYTADNIGDSNNVTVTAALYKDGEPWSDVTTSYASTSVNLSLTNAAPVAEPFTVKVTDLNGNTTTCAPDGSTVIEVPQSTSFRVEMTSGTSFPESQLDYHAANGDVAGTNTISAWNGTSGVYEVYAAGGVGEQASMWANGQRIFQIRVTSRPFTSDTTMDFDLKVGNTYTFAINPNNKNASFTFNTANGDALQTSIVKGAYPDANGIYYCKVKATQAAGKIGVYCTLDGVLYKVFTVNTIA